ncbi:MAG: hypothetical protein BGO07_02040 [Alphaproteobacteria bacterium 40-19]|nr:MAG: hypothetical protein BGO07_02040 [Alphaproteobacteria bacterium 40-19]
MKDCQVINSGECWDALIKSQVREPNIMKHPLTNFGLEIFQLYMITVLTKDRDQNETGIMNRRNIDILMESSKDHLGVKGAYSPGSENFRALQYSMKIQDRILSRKEEARQQLLNLAAEQPNSAQTVWKNIWKRNNPTIQEGEVYNFLFLFFLSILFSHTAKNCN